MGLNDYKTLGPDEIVTSNQGWIACMKGPVEKWNDEAIQTISRSGGFEGVGYVRAGDVDCDKLCHVLCVIKQMAVRRQITAWTLFSKLVEERVVRLLTRPTMWDRRQFMPYMPGYYNFQSLCMSRKWLLSRQVITEAIETTNAIRLGTLDSGPDGGPRVTIVQNKASEFRVAIGLAKENVASILN